MPARVLPTIPQADVASHNDDKSCYVTIGTRVYDVTEFLDSHPGGAELITEYGGKDVKDIMEDVVSHAHSESAYEILDEYHIGFMATDSVIAAMNESSDLFKVAPLGATDSGMKELKNRGGAKDMNARNNVQANGEGAGKAVYEATGMSGEDDLSKDTDMTQDYKQHKFLDLNKPLFLQVWNGGFSKQFYLEQVHRPRHYKGGESAPLFGNFLEPLTKTPWYVVPLLWWPCVAYMLVLASMHITSKEVLGYFSFGLFFWTFAEYVMHRGLFHMDTYLPDNRVAITAHFLLHGIHHYLPMDKLRLVMPPTLFIVLATPFWKLAHALFWWNWYIGITAFAGGMFGYTLYDVTHWALHHKNLPAYYKELKKYHLQHHFADYENGFGVTSRFWDRIFGTELLPPPTPKVLKTV